MADTKFKRYKKQISIACGFLFISLVVFTQFTAESTQIKHADLVVYGDYLVSMQKDHPVLEDGAVAVVADKIVAMGTRIEIDREFTADKTVQGKNRILMPGLINGHTHSAMTLFRGMVDDLDLMTWLNDYVFPMEGRFVSREFVHIGSQLACWEMIKSGTTTFVDMYFYPDEIAKVIKECGLRAVIAAPHIDFPSPGFKGWDDSFAAAQKFITQWQGKHPRITPAFAPHAPYTVSPEHLKATVEKAQAMKVRISTHLAEDPAANEYSQTNFKTSPVKHVSGLGMYSQKLIAAHMVQLDEEDIALTAKAGVGAIHNPTSNMKLGAGISPVPAMLKAGVNVGLGTDGAASNNDLDLWEEVRLAALLHKVNTGDPTALPAKQALSMATRIGAKAIYMDQEIGQLSVGRQADMIQLSLDETDHLPLYDVISHLVYVLDGSDVVTTIVAGQLLMQDRNVLTIDETELRQQVKKKSAQIRIALKQPTEK